MGVAAHSVYSQVIMSVAVVALALLESVQAFQAPAAMKAPRSAAVQMFSEGDIGVLPPLGVYDPLGLIETRNMARYAAMLGVTGCLIHELLGVDALYPTGGLGGA